MKRYKWIINFLERKDVCKIPSASASRCGFRVLFICSKITCSINWISCHFNQFDSEMSFSKLIFFHPKIPNIPWLLFCPPRRFHNNPCLYGFICFSIQYPNDYIYKTHRLGFYCIMSWPYSARFHERIRVGDDTFSSTQKK